jgi:hypothetical protein
MGKDRNRKGIRALDDISRELQNRATGSRDRLVIEN